MAQWLRAWHCHCCDLGHCCGSGSIPPSQKGTLIDINYLLEITIYTPTSRVCECSFHCTLFTCTDTYHFITISLNCQVEIIPPCLIWVSLINRNLYFIHGKWYAEAPYNFFCKINPRINLCHKPIPWKFKLNTANIERAQQILLFSGHYDRRGGKCRVHQGDVLVQVIKMKLLQQINLSSWWFNLIKQNCCDCHCCSGKVGHESEAVLHLVTTNLKMGNLTSAEERNKDEAGPLPG